MKFKILNVMDEYLLSNPLFYRGGQNGSSPLKLRPKLQGVKNDFRKMAASVCYFYTEIGRYIFFNRLTLAIFAALCAGGDPSKMGKEQVFLSKVCMPVTQKY